MAMRVLIADDNEFIRRAIGALLSKDEVFEVCGEAADGRDALEKADALKPDVVLLDISMPGMDGLSLAHTLSQEIPAPKILIISHHDAEQLLPRSLHAGAHGCVDKARMVTDLLPMLKRVLSQ